MTHHGISLGVCKDTVFSLLHIADCAGDGIYAVKIERSAIRACTIHQVEGNGIYLDAMVDSTITDNGIYLCGLCGIKVSDL